MPTTAAMRSPRPIRPLNMPSSLFLDASSYSRRSLSLQLLLSAPVAHVHPERPDPRDDALGHDAGGRPVVAPHPVRRRVGDEAARLLEREEDASAARSSTGSGPICTSSWTIGSWSTTTTSSCTALR